MNKKEKLQNSNCLTCRWFNGETTKKEEVPPSKYLVGGKLATKIDASYTCMAFPYGIPTKFLYGGAVHSKEEKGQLTAELRMGSGVYELDVNKMEL